MFFGSLPRLLPEYSHPLFFSLSLLRGLALNTLYSWEGSLSSRSFCLALRALRLSNNGMGF